MRSPPSLGRATRVEDLKRALLVVRGVRVAEYHRGRRRERLPKARGPAGRGAGIVHDAERHPGDRDLEGAWEHPLELGGIDVAVDRLERRSERRDLPQGRKRGDVSRVQHEIGVPNGLDACLRQTSASSGQVRIGDDRDQHCTLDAARADLRR